MSLCLVFNYYSLDYRYIYTIIINLFYDLNVLLELVLVFDKLKLKYNLG